MHEETDESKNYYFNLGIKLWNYVDNGKLFSKEDFDKLWSDFDKNYQLENDLNQLYDFYEQELNKGDKYSIDTVRGKRDELLGKYVI